MGLASYCKTAKKLAVKFSTFLPLVEKINCRIFFSGKTAKISTVSRRCKHPIETLVHGKEPREN